MAIDFPSSPTIGQTFTSTTGQTYTWSGVAWRVLVPGSQMSRTVFTATAGQTIFSMNYTPGFIDVYRNGVKLVNGADFTATSATTIVLANACNVGDTLEVMSIAQVAYTDAAKAEDVYSVVRGFKNRIINGDMRIDQRNAGGSTTVSAGSAYYSCDRWQQWMTVGGKYSVQRSTIAPTDYTNSLLATSVSAYSVLSTDSYAFSQQIEGLNFSDLGWGTAGAKTITLSFWVRSSLTGTFGGAISNSAVNRSCPFTYIISAANTWEQKTVTIAGDTTGTWLTDTGIGARLWFSLGAGSNYLGTAGAWAAADYRGATGQTSVVATNGATFYLTGVQLEAGTVTNPVFERRPYGLELSLCQRYYQTMDAQIDIAQNGTSYCYATWFFKVTMRAAPTVTQTGTGVGGQNSIRSDGAQWFATNSALRVTAATASAEL